MTVTRVLLDESELPAQWYNILPDLPSQPPPQLDPATFAPVSAADLAALFPPALIEQDEPADRYVEIPDQVRRVYQLWRPTPLHRAYRLEQALGTPAKILYKYEGVSPSGSHKPNTAVPQAFYNAEAGARKLATETGAGQWGTALAFACAQFGLDCEVWQVKSSYHQKPYRKFMIEAYGGTVHASPSELTAAGRAYLAQHPGSPGSIAVCISEAVETALAELGTNYALGSVLNCTLMHQTVIGEEAIRQLAKIGLVPDVVIGCAGGGSNFGGLTFPFLREKLAGRIDVTLRAVEPALCPTLTRGVYAYDYGDAARLTPLMKMLTLGHDFVPDAIHAGGLRYHGVSPLLSHLLDLGLIEAVAKDQLECFAAGVLFARTEGIVPAPEATHAIAACIDEARRCTMTGEERTILVSVCGHGHLDLAAYGEYFGGTLANRELSDSELAVAAAGLPPVAGLAAGSR